jgi:hypothetical protein
MEPEVLSVFVEAGREDLLTDKSIRHEMTEDCSKLSLAVGRNIPRSSTFMVSALAVRELEACGLLRSRISQSSHSCLVDRYPDGGVDGSPPAFRYHSYRRERPNHGLSISILYLRDHESAELVI